MNSQTILPRSKLVQRKISSPIMADKIFTTITTNAEGFDEIPIVLVPRSSRVPRLAINIPSGPFVLWQKWHRNMGQLLPGIQWLWPSWCRISHIITRATITYNTAVTNCPTSDNIMVDVDLSLTLRIGPDADAAQNFVYKLGASHLDQLISAEVEESIRGLVYQVKHDQVNANAMEFSVAMLSSLSSKIKLYGVEIMGVNILKVKLPLELQDMFERMAVLKTQISEMEKNHVNRVRALEDEATRSIDIIRKSNERKLQDIMAEKKRYYIEQRENEEAARGRARVEEVRAMTEADVAFKKSLGSEAVDKIKARQEAEALLKKTHIICQTMKIDAEQKTHAEIKNSEAELAAAESKAAAMIARAEAESDGAEALKEKRKYELEWERLKVLETIAANKNRKFITGNLGDSILKQLIPEV